MLPAGIRKKYSIVAGSSLSIVEWAGTIGLVSRAADPVDELRGMLAGTGYSSEEFLAERRRNRDRYESA
jgi:hypothetical protein